jgi:2-oxo-4-hydroxy-4-carboxy-5-ureidoimidazoline decarboxylase
VTLNDLNRLPEAQAEAELSRCCGSIRWARLMAAERPFRSLEVLLAAAERLWWSLAAADWLEAFAAHPRIGDRARSAWSAEEQSGVSMAPSAIRTRLAAGNHEYEQRFGYTFIVCAAGLPGEALASILERRLGNRPSDELQVAADEQRKITEVRLRKLITP